MALAAVRAAAAAEARPKANLQHLKRYSFDSYWRFISKPLVPLRLKNRISHAFAGLTPSPLAFPP